MKPIKLVIEGINSFTDAQTLDFEAVGRNNLFCICGKTGAGKTTVFDSLMLALYGKSGKGNLADVVNLSLMKARVILDFVSGTDIYTVDRTITCKYEKDGDGNVTDRRKAVTDCMLYKNGEPEAKGADETNEVISRLIGLDASEFKNVYLLEQGEYADFLKKPPAEQTKAVGKIFSLMRFDEVYKLAAKKRDEADARVREADSAIGALGEVSPERLKDERSALAALKAKAAAQKKTEAIKRDEIDGLKKIRDKYLNIKNKQLNVKNLMLQSDELKAKLYSAENELNAFENGADKTLDARLAEARKKLNELSALAARDDECKRAEYEAAQKFDAKKKALTELEKAQSEMQKSAETAERCGKAFAESVRDFQAEANGIDPKSMVLERVVKTLSDSSDIVEVSTAERDLADELDKYKTLCDNLTIKQTQLETAKADCVKKLALIEMYNRESDALAKQKVEAANKKAIAEKALELARISSHAAAVAAELHSGDICPVCGGKYDGQCRATGADLTALKLEFDKTSDDLDKATFRETECLRHLDRAKSDYSHAEDIKSGIEKETAALQSSKSESRVDERVYIKLIDTVNRVKRAKTEYDKIQNELNKYEPTISALKAKYDAAVVAENEAAKKASEYKAELGENYGKTGVLTENAKKQVEELEQKIKAIEEKRRTLTSAAESLKSAINALEKSLEVARADCPVDIPDFDEQGYNEKQEEYERLRVACAEADRDIAVKETEIKALAEKCEILAKIRAERALHVKEQSIYSELVEITRGKAMLNYVAAEYIDDFTAVASEILGDLSGGKYSMSYDKQTGFTVSDFLNDGKSRKTDTLSGGELFLASLSVAIAIARTQSKGNNAFFFLDEGFGTLDNELIDIVFGALESLSRDCLVGVISHSDALIEKMPSCVEVIEASDTKGSVIKF